MTHLSYHLAARVCLALLAVAAARRAGTLRPAAALAVSMLAVDCGALYQAPWLRIARHVAWPGLLLAGAAWGLGATLRELRTVAPAALLGGYLAAALLAVAWRPAYPATLVGGRVLAVGAVVALLARSRPRTWAQLAAVLPAIGLAVGVVAGAWPLAQAGLDEVARGWHLARIETATTMLATAGAIYLARRAAERTIGA